MIGLGVLIAPAIYATAEEIALRPRHQVGDRYALSLSLDTTTRAGARRAEHNSFREDVELHYAAQVEVLETDAAGIPVRERHEGAELTSERPEGKRELFVKGAVFDLARRGDGSVEIQFRGERAAPAIEKIVGDLLAHQSEYALAALLDPGRPLSVGDRWELDPVRVGEFLRARGIRDAVLDEPATAVLATGDRDALALRYRIPIREFALAELPEGATAQRSKASLEGEVQLDSGGFHRARAHSSRLQVAIDGSLRKVGNAAAGRWRLRRSQSVAQVTETLKDQLASSVESSEAPPPVPTDPGPAPDRDR
jgi:hypothetical protein